MADTTAVSVGVSGFLQKFKAPLVGLACFAVGFLAGRGTAPKPGLRSSGSRPLSGVPPRKRRTPKREGAGRAHTYELQP